MKAFTILTILTVFTVFCIATASAGIDSINYPYADDLITSPKFQLDVTSTASSNCYFNYDHIHNVTVACNGLTTVRIPAVDGTYNITVGDDGGSTITQQITLDQPEGYVIVIFILIFFLLLAGVIFSILNVAGHFLNLDADIKDLSISWISYFAVLAFYGLSLTYFNDFMIVDLMETFMSIGIWTHILIPLVAFILSITIGEWRRKLEGKGEKQNA